MGKVRYPIAGNVFGQVWCQGQSQNQSRRPLTMMCLAKRQFEPGSDRMHMSFGQGLGVRIAEVCDRSIFFLKSCFPRITFLSMICVPFSLMFRFISFSISDLAALGSLVWDFDLLSFAGCHGLFISFVSSCILYHCSVAECIDSGTLSANVGSPRGRLHGVCRVEQERSLPWNDWRWEAGNGFLREMIRASFGCTSVISTNLPQLVTHH